MLLALTSGQQIGLATVAALFIAFALISSMVIPRRNPNFPGEKHLWLYVIIAIVFFVAMMSAVFVFGKDKVAAGTAPDEQPIWSGGNATVGTAVFKTAACGSCHTMEAAKATGNIGPNLDEVKPPVELVWQRVTLGKAPGMPAFAKPTGSLTQQQIKDVAAYVYESTHQ